MGVCRIHGIFSCKEPLCNTFTNPLRICRCEQLESELTALREDKARQAEKYEGYLQSLRNDWTADADERQAYIEKIEAERDKLREALENIRAVQHRWTGDKDCEELCECLNEADEIAKAALQEKSGCCGCCPDGNPTKCNEGLKCSEHGEE